MMVTRRGGVWHLGLYALALVLAAGCGGGGSGVSGGTGPGLGGGNPGASVGGTENTALRAPGGLHPIAGSTVVAYQAGITPGNDATQLGKAVTDTRGRFDITFNPIPSKGAIVYLVATGGDAGSGPNDAISEMTVQGAYCSMRPGCQFAPDVNIDEVSTAAATAALQRFIALVDCSNISGNTQSGTCVDIKGDLGLSRRAAAVNALVDVARGRASAFMAAQPDSSPVHKTLLKLNTIANLLAACIDSGGPDFAACSDLLFRVRGGNNTLEAAGRIAAIPAISGNNTLEAAWRIAAIPAINRKPSLYDLAATHVVYTPALDKAPSDWTLGGRSFGFIADFSNGNNLLAYAVDDLNGALVPVSGSPFAAGNLPISVAVNSFGGIAIVANFTDETLSVFTVDPATGIPTQVAGSPVALADQPTNIVIDPTGRFVYVVESEPDFSSIEAFTLDELGKLSKVTGSPFAADPQANALTVDPLGNTAYVPNDLSNNISAFKINQSSGALTPVAGSPFADINNPRRVVVDPQARFAYVADATGFVSAYAIDGATGALKPISGSPYPAGDVPDSAAMDPGGKFVFVQNDFGHNISVYAINPNDGTLTQVSGSPFAGGVSSVTTDSAGNYLYATNSGLSTVSAYTIDHASGALSQVNVPSRLATGAKNPASVVVDPSGRFVYVMSQFDDQNTSVISGYQIDPLLGALNSVGFPFGTDGDPGKMAIDPFSKFAYVPHANGIAAYAIDSGTGALTETSASPFLDGFTPKAVTVHPNGKFLYAANSACFLGNCAVSGFTIDSQSGALTQLSGSPFAGGTLPNSIMISSAGDRLYLQNGLGETVTVYNLDAGTGNLPSQIDGSPFITMHPVPPLLPPTLEAITLLGDRLHIATFAAVLLGISQVVALRYPCDASFSDCPFGNNYDLTDGDVAWQLVPTPNQQFLYIPVTNLSGKHVYVEQMVPDGNSFFDFQQEAFYDIDGTTPWAMTVDPTSRFAYIAGTADNTIEADSIDQSNGKLSPATFSSPMAAGDIPFFMAVGP